VGRNPHCSRAWDWRRKSASHKGGITRGTLAPKNPFKPCDFHGFSHLLFRIGGRGGGPGCLVQRGNLACSGKTKNPLPGMWWSPPSRAQGDERWEFFSFSNFGKFLPNNNKSPPNWLPRDQRAGTGRIYRRRGGGTSCEWPLCPVVANDSLGSQNQAKKPPRQKWDRLLQATRVLRAKLPGGGPTPAASKAPGAGLVGRSGLCGCGADQGGISVEFWPRGKRGWKNIFQKKGGSGGPHPVEKTEGGRRFGKAVTRPRIKLSRGGDRSRPLPNFFASMWIFEGVGAGWNKKTGGIFAAPDGWEKIKIMGKAVRPTGLSFLPPPGGKKRNVEAGIKNKQGRCEGWAGLDWVSYLRSGSKKAGGSGRIYH